MKKVRSLFRALPFGLALKITLIDGLRHLLLKGGFLRFSQTGEDGILAELLLDQKEGFYIDIGCNHPYKFSNTFNLYLKGWRGLLIDPNERLINLCREVRKLDTSLCLAVSDAERNVTFYEFEEDLVSTIDENTQQSWRGKATIRSERTVRAAPLQTILAEQNIRPEAVTLMSVDVEGHDYEVISSIDFSVIRPKIVVVEIHNLDLNHLQDNNVFRHMSHYGYRLVGYATMNAYFAL